jgi:hypothetical protein
VTAPSESEIVEAAFDRDRLAAMESVFAVGNGEPLRLMPDTPLHRPSTPDRQLPRAA